MQNLVSCKEVVIAKDEIFALIIISDIANSVLKVFPLKKKKLTKGRPVDHFSTSVVRESNSGPSYLEQIQLGVRPGNQGLLPIPRRPAGKSGTPADPTGSGREITVSCQSYGVGGPFIELPGNFSGPKSDIQIKI